MKIKGLIPECIPKILVELCPPGVCGIIILHLSWFLDPVSDVNPVVLVNFGIMGIPTLIYFKGGREVDRQVGMTNYNALKNKLERQLA